MPGTPPTSPRFGAPRYSDTVDTASFSADVNGVTDVFDNAAGPFLSGTAAAIPAASIAGRIYHATDTDQWFLDNGTAWDELRTLPTPSATTLAPFSGARQPNLHRPTYICAIIDNYNGDGNEMTIGPSAATAGQYQVDFIQLPNGGFAVSCLHGIVPQGWYYEFSFGPSSSLTVVTEITL